jgi:protein-tyrosine kinase
MSRIHDALKKIETPQELLEEDLKSRPADGRLLVEVATASTEWKFAPDAMISFDGDGPQQAAEEFRGLRTRLEQLQEKQNLRSVLVTSAVPQEGRSFVAANLARVLSLHAGNRVLLIDADLRGRRLHFNFGTYASPGLAEYLLYETEERDILQRGQADNLFLVPSGRAVAGPTELVGNGRFRNLLSRLSPMFDWIIVDSPPATIVSDACSLSNCCDGILMVVRAKATPFDIVRKALDRFPESAFLGIVLNEIQSNPQGSKRHA